MMELRLRLRVNCCLVGLYRLATARLRLPRRGLTW